MKVTPIKTRKIVPQKDKDILAVLDRYILKLKEGTVVAITSKIIAICEGRVARKNGVRKEEFAKNEADLYLPLPKSKYRVLLTVKNDKIIFTSGIDESNAAGYFVFWPSNSQKSANAIREHLAKKFHLKNLGVVITDTTSLPLRRGQLGILLSHSGFDALNSYLGKPDIFGRKLKMTKAGIAEALAIAAVLVMGEGKEQTPIAIIEDIPFVKFRAKNPSRRELEELHIPLKDDLFEPLLSAVKWKTGGNQKNDKEKSGGVRDF